MKRKTRRHARRRGPGWKSYFLAMVVTVATGLGVGMGVGGAFDPAYRIGEIEGDPTARTTSEPQAGGFSLVPRLRQPMNVLVMATDVHYTYKNGKRVMGLNGNTDTMMLVRMDPAQEQVRILSIPRDTRVPIPGHGTFKINAANPYGGPPLAAQVVANLLGVNVDRYLLINSRAVVQLVDALGGIDVYVPKNLRYRDRAGGLYINLQKGQNHLDGKAAHDFLRFRHDELGDIGRVQRQQAFMQALMAQFLTPATLLKAPELLQVAQENLETNLSHEELVHIVTWGKDLNREKVQLTMLPGVPETIEGVSYWVASEQESQRVVGSFLVGEQLAAAKAPEQYKVVVRDGVGSRQSARLLRTTLGQAGYTQVDYDGLSPEQGQSETQIIAQSADIAGAQALADALGVGKVVVAATGNIYADFTVVMGQDWLDRLAAQSTGDR